VRHAHKYCAVAEHRARGARYPECANAVCFDLVFNQFHVEGQDSVILALRFRIFAFYPYDFS